VKRAERHHLKQDELVHGLDLFTNWLVQNRKSVVNAALVLVGAVLLLSGLYNYRTRQAETARALLSDALEEFHGVVGEGAGVDPDVPTFATAEERYRAALQSFQKVAEDFGSYEAGRQARYYVGLCQAGLKDFDTAETALASIRSGDRDLLYYLGSKALASVRAEKKDYAGAAEIYRLLVEDADNPLPKDYLLYELARVEERAGNREEARLYYERMLAEHPDSQLRGDALTRSEALELERASGASGG
jgi:tetratricopeptide (TPR) repeat protein